MRQVSIEAEPSPQSIELARTALVIIDMQRDFLEPGGFGAALGNDAAAYVIVAAFLYALSRAPAPAPAMQPAATPAE